MIGTIAAAWDRRPGGKREGGFGRPFCLLGHWMFGLERRVVVDSVNARGHCDTTVAL
jgi:hypothetical protein